LEIAALPSVARNDEKMIAFPFLSAFSGCDAGLTPMGPADKIDRDEHLRTTEERKGSFRF
jgi:hypothetical protein